MKEIITQKAQLSNDLAEDLKKAKSFLVFEYMGLTAKEITSLRKKLHEANAKMYIAKNNIFNRAVKLSGNEGFEEITGPCSIIASFGDEIAPFKEIYDIIKAHSFIKYKDGIIESNHIPANRLEALSTMPNREGLYSMLLSCLQASVRNFLYGLKAVGETKNI
ncbi:MAG: 50S ribosomal protein L10 [Mycoplasmataceae bacterium]|nr:50S ribosomal protein L10 [Mycoplasmataceae bacterium]